MTRLLQGNLAKEAYWNGAKRELDIKDMAACYDDLQTFANSVKSGVLRDKTILVLRFGRQNCDREQVGEYLNLLGLKYPEKQFVIISDVELPGKENISPVYIKDARCGATSPLYCIQDDDTVSLNTGTGALYLYVADLELMHRQHQRTAEYQ